MFEGVEFTNSAPATPVDILREKTQKNERLSDEISKIFPTVSHRARNIM